ncbi:GTP-binding protein 2 [Cytospora mali]|uniref:GTP-binding protein 2 n=1 Tax=Cytospora mali TaxID=578113 RepID=A0A194V056_CYTMA|nr:GTP-binding protein 2 [Valsa mali var. pyri (nom. inval.)]
MSVFTFETEPTRVSSPWLNPPETPEKTVTKLEAEPQEGAVEYKLHLLLRPRRPYETISSSTAPDSQRPGRDELASAPGSSTGGLPDVSHLEIAADEKRRKPPSEFYSTTSESRKLRLYHLTTQLLWRLQQSVRYNPLGTTDSLIPKLPDDSVNLAAAVRPGNLWQGLEESKGALYEIGVADDGTLVGLPEDEMEESLLTLKVMAASLGCVVEVARRHCVGECEWTECPVPENGHTAPKPVTRREKLYVVEAAVKPSPGLENQAVDAIDRTTSVPPIQAADVEAKSTTEQLRVTLTGPTDGGKSTLLGTLCTGIFDNGSGRSRTFLLRHRHELASGMTTSVSQMLIGYKNDSHDENLIYSFSDRNIDSWEGIHDLSRDGRLVFVSDSAGHLRFRRTILRGLVGWAPHWTILCLAANDGEMKGTSTPTSSQDEADSPVTEVDQAKAYLDLCLKLRMPLVVVITKLDSATTMSLRSTLTKVLAAIKSAGRVPKLLIKQRIQSDPTRVPAIDEDDIRPLIADMKESGSLLDFVPIVSTSAVKGEGIGLLHALLQNLPIPPTPTARDYIGLALNPEQPDSVFHIEDKFSLSALYGNTVKDDEESEHGTVVAGYLRFGHLAVGDRVLIGPFPPDDDSMVMTPERRASPGGDGLSVSHHSSTELNRLVMRNAVPASTTQGEWYNAHIATIRNLRLPVRLLEPGQTGTIGIIFDMPNEDLSDSIFERPPRSQPKIRKGMVLAMPSKHMVETGLSLQAASGVTGVFEDASTESLIVGSIVKVYIASVRASARILRVSPTWIYPDGNGAVGKEADGDDNDDDDDMFVISDERGEEMAKQGNTRLVYEVQLELLSQREWVEMGSQVVILEGGSRHKSGLEGFVGKVIEIAE